VECLGSAVGPAPFIILSISFAGTIWVPPFIVNLSRRTELMAFRAKMWLLVAFDIALFAALFILTLLRLFTVCGPSGQPMLDWCTAQVDVYVMAILTACFTFVLGLCLILLRSATYGAEDRDALQGDSEFRWLARIIAFLRRTAPLDLEST
jgi:hypothetical protein